MGGVSESSVHQDGELGAVRCALDQAHVEDRATSTTTAVRVDVIAIVGAIVGRYGRTDMS
jgi:hypothetical protein